MALLTHRQKTRAHSDEQGGCRDGEGVLQGALSEARDDSSRHHRQHLKNLVENGWSFLSVLNAAVASVRQTSSLVSMVCFFQAVELKLAREEERQVMFVPKENDRK